MQTINLKAQYEKHLINCIYTATQTLSALQTSKTVTLQQKVEALEIVAKQLSEAKRALFFLINTTEKGS